MCNEPAKNLQKQERTPKGTFARGVSGNPRGRERGSQNKATIPAKAGIQIFKWGDCV